MSYQQQGGFAPQQGQQGGYAPQQGGYPPQQGGYPPQQGGYPPQQGGYPPQQGGYPPQQGGQQGQKKGYTNLILNRSLDSKDQIYIYAVVEALPHNMKPLHPTPDGAHQVVSFSINIKNQSEFIGNMCGIAPTVQDDGSVWVDVSFWDEMADRYMKFLNAYDHTGELLTLAGKFWVEQSVGRDGRTYTNTRLKCYRFWSSKHVRSNQQGGGYAPQSGGYAPQQGGYAPQQGGYAPQQGAPRQGGYAPQQGAPRQGGYAPQQGAPRQGGYAPQQGAPRQGGYAPQQGVPQGGYAPQQPAQAPQQQGGYAPPPAAPQQPAQAPQQPGFDSNGFMDISEDDGELPF